MVFNGYGIVTCNLVPAAVTTVPQADLQRLVSGTHRCSRLLPPSLPVDRPPPAAGTAPTLRGTNVLLLLGDRTGQTLGFKGTRERGPQAGCPYSSTHLPSLHSREPRNQGSRRRDSLVRLWSRLFCLLFPSGLPEGHSGHLFIQGTSIYCFSVSRQEMC